MAESMYRCTVCKHVSFEDTDADKITCHKCGDPYAIRTIGAPGVKLDPISGDFPGATLAWERSHEKAARNES